ncbi:MAG: hypothetical protein QM802_19865 [Agriterribacter sp.]
MAVNIRGAPNVVIAKQTISFASIGITTSNIKNIYLVDNALKSFDPSRTLNPITQFEVGKGYYINAFEDIDLSAYVGPPFPTNSNAIVTEDGNEIIPDTPET